MPGFIARFEVPGPLRFKEKDCNLVFQVSVNGAIYVDFYDEATFGETRNEQIENMKKLASDKVIEDMAHWHEGDKLMLLDGRDVLGDSLTVYLREKGITGSGRIDEIKFTPASEALYHENIIEPYNKKRSEEFNQRLDAAVEPHGPLRSVSYNLNTHGMMAGTNSGSSYSLEWKVDSSIIYHTTSSSSSIYFERDYKIKPEIAQKMIDFVEQRKIAALTKLEIETPLVYDNFTSATIVVTYDDTSVGGESHNAYTLQCGASKMTFREIEEDIGALFKEIEESGECIKNESRENQNPFPGIMGINMMNMIDMQGQPGHEQRPVEMMGLVQCDPDAGKVEPKTQEKWICKCGVENTGKFCCECGNPKSVASEDGTWACQFCNTAGNRGNFCAVCGSPKPK